MTFSRLAGALLAVLLVCLSVGSGSRSAAAGVSGFTVNTTLDDPANPPINDGICDTGEGLCSLRAAVQELNALGGTHTITLPAGTYSLIGAAGEDAAATGDLDLTAAGLTIEGAGSGTTFIQRGFGNHRGRWTPGTARYTATQAAESLY